MQASAKRAPTIEVAAIKPVLAFAAELVEDSVAVAVMVVVSVVDATVTVRRRASSLASVCGMRGWMTIVAERWSRKVTTTQVACSEFVVVVVCVLGGASSL